MPSFRHGPHHGVPGQASFAVLPMPSRDMRTPRCLFIVRGDCHCDDGPECYHQMVFDACVTSPGTELHGLCLEMSISPRQLWEIMVPELQYTYRASLPSYWDPIYDLIIQTSSGHPCGIITDDSRDRRECRLRNVRREWERQTPQYYELRAYDRIPERINHLPASTRTFQQYMNRHSGRVTQYDGPYSNSARHGGHGSQTPSYLRHHQAQSHLNHYSTQSNYGQHHPPRHHSHHRGYPNPTSRARQERPTHRGSEAGSHWSGAAGRERRGRYAKDGR